MTISRPTGSIRILKEWITQTVRLQDPKPIDEMIAGFREVRSLRQQPAHALEENVFDQIYFKRQRDLIIHAYEGVRTLRLLFGSHPKTKGCRVPDWLHEGRIWTR